MNKELSLMNVTEAMRARSSIRAYRPDPVSRELLMEIFEEAARTPSWGNTQPWEVFVADGDALDRVRVAYAENYASNTQGAPEVARPADWPEEAKRRQGGIGGGMTPEVKEAFSQFGALNQAMFHAPAVIFLCMDKALTNWSMYDVGAYSQSVMLLAVERGLSTIPAITSVLFPEVLHRELGIPDSYYVLIGIPIGYADDSNDINKLHTLRDAAADVVRFAP